MSVKKSIVVRVRVAFLAVCLFAAAIVYKITQIQYVQGSHWREIAKESRFQYHKVPATRGNIYSDNESLLATSLPFYKLALDPTICSEEVFNAGIDSLALLLSQHFKDHSKQTYLRKIKNARLAGRQYIRLQSKFIDYQAKKVMMAWPIFREGRTKGGVLFEKHDKRFMPFGPLVQRTIGTINQDKVGAGLEFSFNQQLSGRDGEALFQRMSGNNWKPLQSGNEIKPLQGYDIITTLDINLQDVAQDALYRTLTASDAQYGCVVLMEVATGEIKAMANLGRTGTGSYVENYNYAVGNHGRTEPGSTFKLATMMALFEDSNLTLSDSVDTGNGKYRYRGGTMTDVKEGGYGRLSVQQAFEKSSNVGISLLANNHFKENPQTYIDYLYKFGLGTPLGFQMHGEAKPYIKTTASKSWSAISLPWMSIGYELKLSPLQTLAYYNAIANNGKKIQPIIVKEIRRADQVLERYETRVLNEKICSDETLDKVRVLLEGVVENGTAKNLRSPLYKIAGKTGTAQKIVNGAYSNKTYSASFCGYFPADRPKYSCIVIIDSPRNAKRYGGEIAAPVFKELADKIYARDTELHRSRVEPLPLEERGLPIIAAGQQEELSELCKRLGISLHPSSGDEEWVSVKTTNLSYEAQPRPIAEDKVPDVRGMTLRDALYLLGNYGLKVQTIGSGRVATQSIEPGIKAQRGARITITLS